MSANDCKYSRDQRRNVPSEARRTYIGIAQHHDPKDLYDRHCFQFAAEVCNHAELENFLHSELTTDMAQRAVYSTTQEVMGSTPVLYKILCE
jgi:hypothetical protein